MEDVEIDFVEIPEGQPIAELRERDASLSAILHWKNKDGLRAKASIAMLLHGNIAPDGELATLVVLDFRFLGNSKHRFTSATIRVCFRDKNGNTDFAPEVHKISPEDKLVISPGITRQHVSKGGKVTGGLAMQPVQANIEGNAQKDAKVDTRHAIVLTGAKEPEEGNSPGDTAVEWNLEEDSDHKQKPARGIPTVLRTATLLKRGSGDSFQFSVDIETKTNRTLGSFWGKSKKPTILTPADDMIVDPAKRGHSYNSGIEELRDFQKHLEERGLKDKLDTVNLLKELVWASNEKLLSTEDAWQGVAVVE